MQPPWPSESCWRQKNVTFRPPEGWEASPAHKTPWGGGSQKLRGGIPMWGAAPLEVCPRCQKSWWKADGWMFLQSVCQGQNVYISSHFLQLKYFLRSLSTRKKTTTHKGSTFEFTMMGKHQLSSDTFFFSGRELTTLREPPHTHTHVIHKDQTVLTFPPNFKG